MHARHLSSSLAIGFAACLSLALTAPQASDAAAQSGREEFTAFAVNMAPMTDASAATVEIVINRWTSDAARDRLMTVLQEKGPDELLKALQREPPVGSIRTRSSLAYDFRYARQMPGEDGGRRIVLATDRPIDFREAQSGSRSLDYRFTLLEMRLGPDGTGEGKLAVAVRPELNDHVLVLENYAAQPVMLRNIRKR